METEHIGSLTKALYRVTDRLNDAEPLKWRLRDTALQIREIYSSAVEMPEEERQYLLSRALKDIVTLLDLVSSVSYISRVNYDVLLREYKALGEIKPQVLLASAPNQVSHEVEEENEEYITERQKKILDHLAKSAPISVGELALTIGGNMSEKTVQRDLGELITQGLVQFEGDRRWRKYFISKS